MSNQPSTSKAAVNRNETAAVSAIWPVARWCSLSATIKADGKIIVSDVIETNKSSIFKPIVKRPNGIIIKKRDESATVEAIWPLKNYCSTAATITANGKIKSSEDRKDKEDQPKTRRIKRSLEETVQALWASKKYC